MRIIFMGTPDFAVPTLNAVVEAGHDVVAVYSQPPRAGGRRGKALTPSPVHARATELGVEVRTPVSFKKDADAVTAFTALNADVAVVAAYGLILPVSVLESPRLGCMNVHASLLPRWRGAAPIHRAILAGDFETGVGIMQMEAGLDTGPVRLEGRTPVEDKTSGDLTAELAALGARLMVDVLADPERYPAVPQAEDGVTYAAKIDKVEARLDFTRPFDAVWRQILAFNPPGAFFEHEGERLRILKANMRAGGVRPGDAPGMVVDDKLTIACGEGAIEPVLVQRAGRGVMTTDELLRGFPIPPGTRL